MGGPHKWEVYWNCLADAIDIFGKDYAGSHFMVGMGETEAEMCAAIQRVHDMAAIRIFSLFSPRRPRPWPTIRSPPWNSTAAFSWPGT